MEFRGRDVSDSVPTGWRMRVVFDSAAPDQPNAVRRPRDGTSVPGPVGQEQEGQMAAGPDGVYIISVAARIVSMHPQTLRKYERAGLVRPSRTVGMLRLYSDEDIAKLRMIKHLVDEVRLNLAGVEMALAVFDRLLSARTEMVASPGADMLVLDQTVQDILALLQGRQPHGEGDDTQ